MVREFVDACSEYGVKAGIYLGPHDRHEHLHPYYNTESYKKYYASQIEELMTQYGPIWETWWDGAGADELTTPLYAEWYKIVRSNQPDCVIFGTKNSYPFADVRWMGNEAGNCGNPCWATTDSICIRDEAGLSTASTTVCWAATHIYLPKPTCRYVRAGFIITKRIIR